MMVPSSSSSRSLCDGINCKLLIRPLDEPLKPSFLTLVGSKNALLKVAAINQSTPILLVHDVMKQKTCVYTRTFIIVISLDHDILPYFFYTHH